MGAFVTAVPGVATIRMVLLINRWFLWRERVVAETETCCKNQLISVLQEKVCLQAGVARPAVKETTLSDEDLITGFGKFVDPVFKK